MLIKRIAIAVITMLMAYSSVVAKAGQPQTPLVIAIRTDFKPFTFLNAEGEPAGMFVDMWQLWAQKTGKRIEFLSSDLKTSLENLKNRKADIHSGLLYSPERFTWMSGSQPIYETGIPLFYPLKLGRITDIKELSGQTIAALRGSQPEQFLKINYPGIRVLPCDTIVELVEVSRREKAKGFVIVYPAGEAVIDHLGLSGEYDVLDKMLFREKFHAGVLKNNTELLTLVNKGFNAISQEELADIEEHWISDPSKRFFKTSAEIQLTPEEKKWIRKHKIIRVGIAPVMPPLKFIEKDVIKGIEPDYVALLSEYTGINFQLVATDFKDMDAKVKSGEIDMFLSVYIRERLAYMLLTEPFLNFDAIFVTRSDFPFISGLSALKRKKIAILNGVKLHEKILSSYPEIEIVRVETMEEMFEAVSENKADALISKTFFAAHVMHKYPKLKIAGIADIPREPYFYAVRKDYPELVGILNKAIKQIPKDRVDAIVNKWFTTRVEYRTNWPEILKWMSAIVGFFIILQWVSFVWNRRLAREIDKRKQMHEALEKSESRYRSYIDVTGQIGWVTNADGHIVEDVPSFRKFSGQTHDEVKGSGWAKTLHPDDLERTLQVWNSAVAAKSSYETEYRMRRHDGVYRDLLARGFPVFREDGSIREWVGTCIDITERKLAEEAFRASEERFRRAVVDSPFPILLHAEDGAILQASNSWCEITGYTHEELATIADWTERAYGERKILVQADIDRLYGLTHRMTEGDYTIRTKHGGTRIWEFSSAPLGRLPDGRRLVISMAMDVTERRQAEEALQESERKLSEAQKMAQLGHWSWDVRTGNVEWSEEVYKIFRLDPDTFTPQIDSILSLSPWPEDHERDKELIRKAMESHEKGDYEQRFLRSDGSIGYYYSTFQGKYNKEGNLIFIVGTVLDITERKNAEIQLLKTMTELERSNKELEQFAYIASHDLQEPLRMVSSYTQLLAERYGDKLDQSARDYTQYAVNGAKRMQRLIQDLLSYSRVSTRGQPLEQLEMQDALNEALANLRTAIRETGAQIRTEKLPSIMGDYTQVVQLFQNLISNSIKFRRTDEAPNVAVRSGPDPSDSHFWIIKVCDNGIGIDPKYFDRLFVIFKRLHTQQKYDGTGIGLAFCKKIVLRHGGRIWLESEPGKGTTCCFTLPAVLENKEGNNGQ